MIYTINYGRGAFAIGLFDVDTIICFSYEQFNIPVIGKCPLYLHSEAITLVVGRANWINGIEMANSIWQSCNRTN